jgi:murein DD-endopeptidase MepM/ murein hydrolase activator NlpD
MNILPLVLATLTMAGALVAGPHAPPAVRATAPPASSRATARGVWPLPPPHPVRRGFEPPSTTWGAGHRGVDLGGESGMKVVSALAGTVTFAGVLAGRGVVVVDHGEIRTTYEPVTASVTVGDSVPRGGVIGHLALAGSHCFPEACLHWGLIRGATYLDPLTLVGGGPIRLLPMAQNLFSGTRVGELEGLAEAVGRHVGVGLCRRQ